MKITILVEGRTEMAFKPTLLAFLTARLGEKMPKLDFFPYDGRIPKGDRLKVKVAKSLEGNQGSDHVIALTDVYTGTADFKNADDAKMKMREWVGDEPRFSPHVALYDFEAWLLPYWTDIKLLAGHNKANPGANPESVNHMKPPSYHIKEVFAAGTSSRHYSKVRDASRILRGKDLQSAIEKCAELKSFLNTILRISSGTQLG